MKSKFIIDFAHTLLLRLFCIETLKLNSFTADVLTCHGMKSSRLNIDGSVVKATFTIAGRCN